MRSGQFVSESNQERVLFAKYLMSKDISSRTAAKQADLSLSSLQRYVRVATSHARLITKLWCKTLAMHICACALARLCNGWKRCSVLALLGLLHVFITLLFPKIYRGIKALDAGREVGLNGRPEFFNEAETERIQDAVTIPALNLSCPNRKKLQKIVLDTARDPPLMRGLNQDAAKLPSQHTFDKILRAATVDVVKKPCTTFAGISILIVFFRSQGRRLSIRATASAVSLSTENYTATRVFHYNFSTIYFTDCMTIMLEDRQPERVFATQEAKAVLKTGNLAITQTKQKEGKRRAAMLCTATNAGGKV